MPDQSSLMDHSIISLTKSAFIEASAGTGKTYTIANIYADLLCGATQYDTNRDESEAFSIENKNNELPTHEKILVISFTNAATAELKTRLKSKIKNKIQQIEDAIKKAPKEFTDDNKDKEQLSKYLKIWANLRKTEYYFDSAPISTIHGFCSKILKDFSTQCNIPINWQVVTTSEDKKIKKIARRVYLKHISSNPNSPIKSEKYYKIILDGAIRINQTGCSDILNLLNSKETESGEIIKNCIQKIISVFNNEKDTGQEISNNDLINKLNKALDNKALATQISKRFSHLIIDEFQDTDPVQWQIFRKIFLNNGLLVFCVGDPKQAIYEFRNGDIATYQAAKEIILEKTKPNILKLKKNYRSTKTIVSGINSIFKNDPNGILNYSDAIANTQAIEEKPAIYIRKIKTSKKTPLLTYETLIANDICELKNNNPNLNFNDIAILVNEKNEANKIANKLYEKQIPFSLKTNTSIFDTDEFIFIKDLLSAFLNPRKEESVSLLFLHEPFDAENLFQKENIDNFTKRKELLNNYLKIWEKEGFASAFLQLNQDFSFFKNLIQRENSTRKICNIKHLVEIISTTEKIKKLTPTQVFNYFNDKNNLDNIEEENIRLNTNKSAVFIDTIFKSKGLEFPIVFVVPSIIKREAKTMFFKYHNNKNEINLALIDNDTTTKNDDKNTFPASISSEIKKIKDEYDKTQNLNSACLFYVATTRAKKKLYIYQNLGDKYDSTLYTNQLLNHLNYSTEEINISVIEEVIQSEPIEKDDNSSIQFNDKELNNRFNSKDNVLKSINEKIWKSLSFSSLTRDDSHSNYFLEDEDTERPAETENISIGNYIKQNKYFDLPSGAQAGSIIHEIFEEIKFNLPEKYNEVINKKSPRLKKENENQDLDKMLYALVSDTLTKTHFSSIANKWTLSNLYGEDDCQKELKFYIPIKKEFHTEKIISLFESWGGVYKKTAQSILKEKLEKTVHSGEINGSIDLVFKQNERFYILDWKTNFIANSTSITTADVEKEIIKHAYPLQWTIYTVALRKYLKFTLGEKYKYGQTLGGIFYFFVRWQSIFEELSIITDENKLNDFENLFTD